MSARLRSGLPVGAWLLKANPDVWDVVGAIEHGDGLDAWRLAPSYRVDLIRVGDPVVLWVTRGSGGRAEPGVRALGEVTALPWSDVGDPTDARWRDRHAAGQVRPYVGVALGPLGAPVGAAVLRADPRTAGAEIFRCPRMGSPVAFTPHEFAAVAEYCAELPASGSAS